MLLAEILLKLGSVTNTILNYVVVFSRDNLLSIIICIAALFLLKLNVTLTIARIRTVASHFKLSIVNINFVGLRPMFYLRTSTLEPVYATIKP